MGFRQESAALKVQLPHATKHVLQVLAFHACELCGRAWPGVALIALETGLGSRAVRLGLEALRRRPELVTVYRYPKGGRGVTTEYLVMPEVAKLSTAECGKCSNRTDTLHHMQGLTKAVRLNPAPDDTKRRRTGVDQPSLQPQPSARAPASGPPRTGPNGPEVDPHHPTLPLSEPPNPTALTLASDAVATVTAMVRRRKAALPVRGEPGNHRGP